VYCRVIACDFDGTSATNGHPAPELYAALAAARGQGIVTLLVTGRVLEDVQRLCEEESPFDVVVAADLIEHLANPGLFLERCREHLRDGGLLCIVTPNAHSLNTSAKALLGVRAAINPKHTSWYDPTTLKQLLARHGFRALLEGDAGGPQDAAIHVLDRLQQGFGRRAVLHLHPPSCGLPAGLSGETSRGLATGK